MKCFSCQQELAAEFPEEETSYQFDNALWVGFFGGYGMFVDDIETEFGDRHPTIAGAAEEAVICHDCAHALCEQVPWIGRLIKPETSHAHTAAFWESHPDHEGWDNPTTGISAKLRSS